MTYYNSYLVAIKDLQTHKVKIKHFDEEEKAIQYVLNHYKGIFRMTDTLQLTNTIRGGGFCTCDPCFYLLETHIKNCVYYCLDEDCDCTVNGNLFNNCQIDISRTLEEIYKNDRFIISIYYQVIMT
jgi:hypothetical protein